MLMAWDTLFGICSGYISPYSFRAILTAGIVHCVSAKHLFIIC